MHEMRAILGVLCLLSFPLAPGAGAQPQEPVPQSTDARQNTPPTLLALRGVIVSTASLLGSKVKNLQGENVGTVQHLMINPRTGQVLYAVVSMGGFLGMGEKTLIVPWQALEVTRDDNALVLNVSQQWLQQAPAEADGQTSPPAGPDLRSAGSGSGTEHQRGGSPDRYCTAHARYGPWPTAHRQAGSRQDHAGPGGARVVSGTPGSRDC